MTILKKFDREPDLCPVNIKLSAYNNSKIPVLGKCSLTLKHKKDHFDVSFIVVDSKSVPILGLATSESLNLIKRISAINVSGEQFLSEFSDCFGEIGTLKNTHHIEIKDNVTDVITHANVFAPLSTDHCPVTISISKRKNRIHGDGFWNSTVLCFQTKVILEKQKILLKPFTITEPLFRMSS